jgi:microcin C transport system substrate-binding protein
LPADAGGDSPKNLELPQIVGQLTILPKHWWQANEPRRDIAATTLESPLGSGPYRIKDFEPGRTITYEQVENYWGKDLNVRIGRDNFAELRFEYFRDAQDEVGRAGAADRGNAGKLPLQAHRAQEGRAGDLIVGDVVDLP